ncbi:MAG: 5-oxopent-3-ene-1,2,5-tricarboxylate decarboxylase [Solibacterales bacterium]|nr:5-oxopent-3-ene-1,2,5-tricarboxylate decarboxylase [Bryobacterales bacterium]|tara:strand:+ start:1488 stop:2336 length:849 start_codon:yes stop_codon:yes gene_type:complete
MRLVTFTTGDDARAGIAVGDQIIDLASSGFEDVLSFLEAGDAAVVTARDLVTSPREVFSRLDVELLAPVPTPQKFICIGLNYLDHAIESGKEVPTTPVIFTKYNNAVIGPGHPIELPSVSDQVDYEAEFAFVIGKSGKNIRAEDWEEYVFGYTIVHDVSARDWQLATSQWTIGKTFDTFGPMGPELVSKEEITDPHNLRISLELNGQVLQDSNTSQLIFNIPALVEHLSKVMTLSPGDVVSTGTPPGVGMARKPPIFMKPGDDVAITIEGIGELRNPVVQGS